jgi:hypothetical protein
MSDLSVLSPYEWRELQCHLNSRTFHFDILSSLPTELVSLVLQYLQPVELFALRRVRLIPIKTLLPAVLASSIRLASNSTPFELRRSMLITSHLRLTGCHRSAKPGTTPCAHEKYAVRLSDSTSPESCHLTAEKWTPRLCSCPKFVVGRPSVLGEPPAQHATPVAFSRGVKTLTPIERPYIVTEGLGG